MCLAILLKLKYAVSAKRLFVSWCNVLKVTAKMYYILLVFLENGENLANEELQVFLSRGINKIFAAFLAMELYSGGGNVDGTTCLKNWAVININNRSKFSLCAS